MIRFILLIAALIGVAVAFAPGKPSEDWDINSESMVCHGLNSRFHTEDMMKSGLAIGYGETQCVGSIEYFHRNGGKHQHE
jgi:hypothetical protein